MNFADTAAMLADAAQQPAFIVVSFLLVFIAGAWAGMLAARRTRDEDEYLDGVEQAALEKAHMRTASQALIEKQSHKLRANATPAPTRPRVRAIGDDELKPSYDSRRVYAGHVPPRPLPAPAPFPPEA